MEPWEDELLWDDDFSDEEEDAEEQIEETDPEMAVDGFADWEDSSDGVPENETLEEALAEERTLELERELEQDEHPRDYHAVLEDEGGILRKMRQGRDCCHGRMCRSGVHRDRKSVV